MPLVIDDRLQPLLLSKSRSLDALPTQRRTAVHIRYGEASEELSMRNMAAMMPSVRGCEVNDSSSTYRALQNTPSDSWEIELCVGIIIQARLFACTTPRSSQPTPHSIQLPAQMLVAPNWEHVQRLGRSLLVLKVHKQPAVCEAFFMPRDSVVETYKVLGALSSDPRPSSPRIPALPSQDRLPGSSPPPSQDPLSRSPPHPLPRSPPRIASQDPLPGSPPHPLPGSHAQDARVDSSVRSELRGGLLGGVVSTHKQGG